MRIYLMTCAFLLTTILLSFTLAKNYSLFENLLSIEIPDSFKKTTFSGKLVPGEVPPELFSNKDSSAVISLAEVSASNKEVNLPYMKGIMEKPLTRFATVVVHNEIIKINNRDFWLLEIINKKKLDHNCSYMTKIGNKLILIVFEFNEKKNIKFHQTIDKVILSLKEKS